MRGVRALAILLPLLVPAAFPAAALAHASLLRSDPAAGSVVPQAPTQIVLHFDEPVQDAGTSVVATSGASVLAGRARLEHGDSRALVVPLRAGLGDGDYTVRWRVVSSDGHIVSGVLAIGVGRNRPPPQAATTQTSSLDWPFLVARFAYFLGLMLLVGGAVYRVAVFRPVIAAVSGKPREMAELREGARANSLLLGAAVLMLAGGWIALTREGAEVAGVSFWQAFNHHGPIGSALGATRFGREFGRGIDLGAAFCVATAAAFAVARRSRVAALALAIPAAALGAWAVIVPGLSGHAGDPGLGLPAVAVDALHTLAAAVWVGGLVQLVLVTPHATRGLPDGERTRVRTAATTRFSKIALASVAVLAATGLGRALWAVSSPAQVWQTGYGRALAVKTGLLAGLVALGYLNRRRLSAFGAIRRRGAIEIGLMMAVLAVVSLLTDLPPANTPGVGSAAPAPAGGPVSLRLADGSRLALWPGFAGANAVDLRAPGATQPTIHVGTAGAGAVLRRAPDGSYAGLLSALPEGRIRLRIESAQRRLTADVTLGVRSGAPPVPAAPAATGATAAAEASDLAVGGQRVGPPRAAADAALADRRGRARRDRARRRQRGRPLPRLARRVLPGAGSRRRGPGPRRRDAARCPGGGCDARPPRRRRPPRPRPAAQGGPRVRRAPQPAGRECARLRAGAVGGDDVHRPGSEPAHDRHPRRRALADHRHDAMGPARKRRLEALVHARDPPARPVLGADRRVGLRGRRRPEHRPADARPTRRPDLLPPAGSTAAPMSSGDCG